MAWKIQWNEWNEKHMMRRKIPKYQNTNVNSSRTYLLLLLLLLLFLLPSLLLLQPLLWHLPWYRDFFLLHKNKFQTRCFCMAMRKACLAWVNSSSSDWSSQTRHWHSVCRTKSQVKILNKPFGNEAKFKTFGTDIWRNLEQAEIQGMPSEHSVSPFAIQKCK